MIDDREKLVLEFDKIAEEFEKAAQHCKISAKHYRDKEVPRACAHAFAALGHSSIANKLLIENAELHSKRARTE